MDRFACYELCVQAPRFVAPFLYAVHGGHPTVLREDFCGTAALSRRWVEDGLRAGEQRRAIGVDLDEEVLERAERENQSASLESAITLVHANAVECPAGRHEGCDIVFVGNFSIGYIHERAVLVRYLRASRARIAAGNAGFGGGVFVCDTYSGPSAFKPGSVTRVHPGRGKEVVRYTWEQRDADALTAMVTNAIHFQVEQEGDVVVRHPEAFLYRWRVWSIPELREALREAGFAGTEVYQDVGPHVQPMTHGGELRETGIVCVVGRT